MKAIKTLLLSLTFVLIQGTSLDGQITYAGEVADLIYTKCASCHRPGEIGPMSFTNYDEVKAWGGMIKYVTGAKLMPPWQPDPTYNHYLEENYLTDDEIAAIAEWVDNGMERGDVSQEPSFPDFPEGSVVGVPDAVFTMAEPWVHRGNNKDDYRYFVFETGYTEDKIIKTIEFRPGNSKIVHHALIFEDRSGRAKINDDATPEYGFNGFGSFTGGDISEILNQKQFPGYAPGQKPILYPDGIGKVLHAGADLVVQMHYAPWMTEEMDQSSFNVFFMDEDEEELEREVQGHIMVPLPEVIDDLFFIPADTERTFHGKFTVPRDVSLLTIAPHMHLLGQHWEVWMEKPDGERVDLIRINEWDFNWQGTYNFDRFIHAPQGTVIHAVASYDNTADNPSNPSSPPQFVSWGENTTDEMYYLPIGYVDYMPGDEDIEFGGPILSVEEPEAGEEFQLHPIMPNPVNDLSIARFTVDHGQVFRIRIIDMSGRVVRTIRKGEFFNSGDHSISFSSKNLSAGVYFMQLSGKNQMASQKFVKQ